MFGLKFEKIDLQKLPVKKMVIIGQFLVIIFCVRSCRLKDLTINSNGVKLDMYEGKVNQFETTVNKLGEKVSTQDQVIAEKTKALQKELLKNSTLSTLNEQVKFETTTTIKNLLAKYNGMEVSLGDGSGDGHGEGGGDNTDVTIHDTIIKNGDTSIVEGIKYGTKFKADTSKWYSIAGSIQKDGIKFDSLNFVSKFTLNIGEKRVKGIKGWLFGKKEAKVELINPNPYTKVDVMKNIKLEDKKWYDNGWLKFSAGVLLGGLIILKTTH